MSWRDKWGGDFDELAAYELVQEYANTQDKNKFIEGLKNELDAMGDIMPEPEGDKEKECPKGQHVDKETGECVPNFPIPEKKEESKNQAITGAPNPEGDTGVPVKDIPLTVPKDVPDSQAQCEKELVSQGHSAADAKKLCGERNQKPAPQDSPTPSAGKEATPNEPREYAKDIADYRAALILEIKQLDKDCCSDLYDSLSVKQLVAMKNTLMRLSKNVEHTAVGKRRTFTSLNISGEDKKKLNKTLGLPEDFDVVIEKR